MLELALRNIYNRKFNPMSDIEQHLFHEFCKVFNKASVNGMNDAPKPDDDFIEALKHNNAVFAAFKTHRMQNDMVKQLLDENGVLKPFEQWRKDVSSIASHQCQAWLQTEYDTAVLRARQAANWQQFIREKDVLPNLLWVPSTSPNPGADHMPFWNTILPIEHPFWTRHRPGDRWNCKCDLRSTDKPVTPVPDDDSDSNNPQPGLDNNPGIDAKIFSDSHPYIANAYPGAKETVEKTVRRQETKDIKKEARRILQGSTLTHPHFDKKINISRRSIDEWTNQPHMHYDVKNKLLLKISKIFGETIYRGFGKDASTKAGAKWIHLFEIEIMNDKSWIIVKEYEDGNVLLYSITDSPEILNAIKKK